MGGNKQQVTHRIGAARGKAKATTLLSTMMAAMALAVYLWYVSIMYPITHSSSRTVPAPKMAAPMFLQMIFSVQRTLAFWLVLRGISKFLFIRGDERPLDVQGQEEIITHGMIQ